jgi:Nucleotidyl transferase AbiEii toxin, Type IV TA system
MSEPSLPDKVLAIHERLTRAKTPHAFGGALALAYYAEPRATIDVDLNLFVSPSSYPDVERALAEIGVGEGVDPEIVERDGQCRLRWGNTPIDLFFAYDALHDAMRRAIRSEPFGDARIPILAPEHLLVCKAIFNRPKDWLDIEQMMVCVEELDTDEVGAWLDRIVGADDPRRERFDRLVEADRA